MITDYDCWHPDHDPSPERKYATLQQNADNAQKVCASHQSMPDVRGCKWARPVTSHHRFKARPQGNKEESFAIIGKYIS